MAIFTRMLGLHPGDRCRASRLVYSNNIIIGKHGCIVVVFDVVVVYGLPQRCLTKQNN